MDGHKKSNTNQIVLMHYQQEAVETVYTQLMLGNKKIRLDMAVGTGATTVVISLLDRLFSDKIISSALILSYYKESAAQTYHMFSETRVYQIADSLDYHEGSICILTYYKFLRYKEINRKFDIVIFMDVEKAKSQRLQTLFSNSILVGITRDMNSSLSGIFRNIEPVYSKYLTDENSKKIEFLVPHTEHQYAMMVEDIVARLLTDRGYLVQREPRLQGKGFNLVLPDLLAVTDEQDIIIEIKAYRSRNTSREVIDNAISQLLKKKSVLDDSTQRKRYTYCLVLFSDIDMKDKSKIYQDFGVVVWDIANLLYIAAGSAELTKELSRLVYFSISDITPTAPVEWHPPQTYASSLDTPTTQGYAETFLERLNACETGRVGGADAEYERICSDIIIYLFAHVFTQISTQHKTDDEMFRMDLLCGIKGGSEFWNLLIQHYNTRFVVFEYKNYAKELSQNLIYTTEKYLFNAALRNVSVIISRKGFSDNANAAALGCLKENGKLIIGLSDKDLLEMLNKKEKGGDPSDYLLYKLEKLLMSISK